MLQICWLAIELSPDSYIPCKCGFLSNYFPDGDMSRSTLLCWGVLTLLAHLSRSEHLGSCDALELGFSSRLWTYGHGLIALRKPLHKLLHQVSCHVWQIWTSHILWTIWSILSMCQHHPRQSLIYYFVCSLLLWRRYPPWPSWMILSIRIFNAAQYLN